jgi:hypothetical protein
MQSHKHVRSSSIFLIELILAIFFFSLASAVCVQIFVKSHLLSRDSERLSHAVNECCSVAEVLTTAESLDAAITQLQILCPHMQVAAPSVTICYDAEFKPCSQKDAAYQLTVTISDISGTFADNDSNALSTYEARLAFKEYTSDTVIYALTVSHHIAKEVQP